MMSRISSAVEIALAPIKRRVLGMVARAVVNRARDDGLQLLQLSVLAGETRDGVERFGEFGLASSPPEGSEALVVFLGGNRDHGAVVGVEDRRVRPQGVGDGDTVLYNAHGTTISLAGGAIVIQPGGADTEVRSNAVVEGDLAVGGAAEVGGEATVTGNVVSMGNVTAAGVVTGAQVADALGTSLAGIKAIFNAHTHPSPGAPPDTQI